MEENKKYKLPPGQSLKLAALLSAIGVPFVGLVYLISSGCTSYFDSLHKDRERVTKKTERIKESYAGDDRILNLEETSKLLRDLKLPEITLEEGDYFGFSYSNNKLRATINRPPYYPRMLTEVSVEVKEGTLNDLLDKLEKDKR